MDKILYINSISGASGDMLLSAFVDLGIDFDFLKNELSKLNVTNYELTKRFVKKNGITATKVDVKIDEGHVHRHLKDVYEIIENSNLSNEVISLSKSIFLSIAEAEAKIHGETVESIHFHEVGSLDAIIDVVGSAICLIKLNPEKVICSKIHVGTGFTKCQHGKMPVPAPATLEILKNIPIYSKGIECELCTPTGAAILKNIVNEFGNLPSMEVEKIAYGAANKDLEIPNLIRFSYGTSLEKKQYKEDKILKIETNVDDISSEVLGYVQEKLMNHNALDVYFTPIYMKKNRPAYMITVLTYEKNLDTISEIIFKETTTFGIRIFENFRKKVQEREIRTIKTEFGDVRVKVSLFNGKITNIKPEFEDIKKIAKENNISLKNLSQKVIDKFNN